MRVKIKDICKIVSGGDKPSTVSTAPTNECNVPIYGNALDKEGLYGFTNFSTIDEEAITIAARGSNCGASFLRKKPFVPIVRLLTLIPDKEKILPEYLYYVIKNTNFKSTGSGQPQITIPQVSECEINITEDINKQKNISAVLYAIDKKIELNKKINDELEAIAKTLYDYWFLQFEFPNEEGKPYKSSGGKMVWNEELKREIPEGWSIKILDDIAEMITKSLNPEENQIYEYYSIPSFDDTELPIMEVGGNIDSNKYCVPNESILVSKLNPQFKRLWYVGKATEFSICSTEFIPFISRNGTKEFLYSVLNSEAFYQFMVQSSSSSTGSRKRMQPELMKSFIICYPNDIKIIQKYCEAIQGLLEKILAGKRENQELTSLRDFLLPLLMNGQVGFKE